MNLRKLVTCAMLIALCAVGANIKVVGTIAFDSMPAFLGALILGPWYGGLLGAAGYFLTSLTSGFPMTLPVHLVLMISMALTMIFFNLVQKSLEKKVNVWVGRIAGIIVALIFNVGVGLLMVIPLMGVAVLAYAPELLPVALANVLIAEVVYMFIPKKLRNSYK